MKPGEVNPYGIVGELRGLPLRYVLAKLLHENGGAMTVKELVAGCEAAGVVFTSRASKLVSDALRWEVRRGRAIRLARGIYRYGHAPRSTLWRIRKRVGEYIAYLAEFVNTCPTPHHTTPHHPTPHHAMTPQHGQPLFQ